MVIEDVLVSIWATLPGPGCHARGLCPVSLDPFTIGLSSPLCISEVELYLALSSMPGEVKLGNDDLPVVKFGYFRGSGFICVET